MAAHAPALSSSQDAESYARLDMHRDRLEAVGGTI
jgi:hypothetical protein